jgi:hypothetical protein
VTKKGVVFWIVTKNYTALQPRRQHPSIYVMFGEAAMAYYKILFRQMPGVSDYSYAISERIGYPMPIFGQDS